MISARELEKAAKTASPVSGDRPPGTPATLALKEPFTLVPNRSFVPHHMQTGHLPTPFIRDTRAKRAAYEDLMVRTILFSAWPLKVAVIISKRRYQNTCVASDISTVLTQLAGRLWYR